MLLCAIDTITAPIVSRRAPFDAIRDFTPITQLTQSPNVWLVNPSFAARSMKELVDMAKAKPNQIDYASSGVGSMQHLGGELFNRMAGIQLNHVPYKGGPPGSRRRARRARTVDTLGHAGRAAVHQSREAAGARSHHHEAISGGARRADGRPKRWV